MRSQLVLLLSAVAVAPPAAAKLLLTATPPLGFNTFDSYPGLNHSDVIALADTLASQLKPHGYEYLVLCVFTSPAPIHLPLQQLPSCVYRLLQRNHPTQFPPRTKTSR